MIRSRSRSDWKRSWGTTNRVLSREPPAIGTSYPRLRASSQWALMGVTSAIGWTALVQLNGNNFLFYNKSLGDLNVAKFTHKHPRSVDGVNDVWHAYPHSSRNLH